MTRDERFMSLAIAKAEEGVRRGQTPFGACLVLKGEVVACAHNTVWKTCDITAHAEVQALRQACRALGTVDLSGAVIYSTCEPCPMCFSACHWARVRRIVYGTSIRDARRCGFHELEISNVSLRRLGKTSVDIRGGVLREDNLALFEQWRLRADRRAY